MGPISRLNKNRLLLLFASLGFSLVLLELMLTYADFGLHIPKARPLVASAWADLKVPALSTEAVLAEDGLHYHKPDDANYNSQGFRDRDEFVALPRPRPGEVRILGLGDSFTFGASAIKDGSNTGFLDLLESNLKADGTPVKVWNTGIPGCGQNEQLLHLRKYGPLMNPDWVVVGFYGGNDFDDNTFPVGRFYVFQDGSYVDRYQRKGEGFKALSPAEAYIRANFEENNFLLKSRVISVLARFRRRLQDPAPKALNPPTNLTEAERLQMRPTLELFSEMQSYCQQNGCQLLVLGIPDARWLSSRPSWTWRLQYQSLLKLLKEKGIQVLDTAPLLREADYTPAPDLHWNKAGHQRAAEALSAYLRAHNARE